MYANRHAGARGIRPVSLGASLLLNGAVVLALIYAAPNVIRHRDPPIEIKFIPIPPPPQPTPQPQPRATHPTPQPFVPRPDVPLPPLTPPIDLHPTPAPDPGPILGLGDGPAATPSPTPLPLVGASIDSRYADAFQPTYPPAERRAGREGRVVVRVLIGVDGRVKQIERVSATSDAFFAATRDQALARWRFTPATRGDVPVEQWKQMGVSFVLKDE
jgi:protein TonB